MTEYERRANRLLQQEKTTQKRNRRNFKQNHDQIMNNKVYILIDTSLYHKSVEMRKT